MFAQSLARRFGASLQTDTSYFAADPYGFAAAVWHGTRKAQSTRVASHAGPGSYVLRARADPGALAAARSSLPPGPQPGAGGWQGRAYFRARDVALQTYAQMAQKVATQLDAGLVERLKAAPHAVAVHDAPPRLWPHGLCRTSYYVAAIERACAPTIPMRALRVLGQANFRPPSHAGRGWAYTAVSSGSDLATAT